MVKRLTAGVFRIDRSALEPVFVIRSSAGVAIAMLGGFLTGQPLIAVAASISAMGAGFGSLQGVYRTRAATMLGLAAAMAFSTAVAFLVAHSVVLMVLALAVWGFAYGMLAALGPGMSVIALYGVIALIIFERYPAPLSLEAACVLTMLAGGLIQTLLLVVLWPIQRYPNERRALATAYRDLAAFAQSSARPTVPSSASLRAVGTALADPRPFGRRAAAVAFQTLLDEAQRIRATLALLATSGGGEYDRARTTVASALNEIAGALESARMPDDPPLEARLREPCDDSTLRALFGQLRAAWRAARVPLRGISVSAVIPSLGQVPGVEEPLAILRENLRIDAPFFRHAVRLAVVLTIAGTIGEVFSLQRGYWVTLTAALVLRPDFTTTFTRGFARIAGTLAGVLFATALVLAVPNTPHAYLALSIFFGCLGYAAFQLNYGLFSVCITAFVVFLLALLGVPEASAVTNRLFATIAGGVLAMLSYVIWPTWEASRTLPRLRELIACDLRSTTTILTALLGEQPRDPVRLQQVSTAVWNARAAAEESLERMLSEPESTHEIDAQLAVGIMTASRRVGLANTALSSLYLDPHTPAFPELRPLVDRLRDTPIEAIEGLRDAWSGVDRALAADERTQAHALRSALDVLVDSLDTLAELWRSAGEAPAPRESPARA